MPARHQIIQVNVAFSNMKKVQYVTIEQEDTAAALNTNQFTGLLGGL